MIKSVNTATLVAHDSSRRRFRIAVIAASVVAAIAGSVLLATRDSGEKATTRGITATLPVPGHPGSVVAGPDALWVALNGDPRRPVGDRPLVRLDPATGTVTQTVHVDGEVSYLARVGGRLIASFLDAGEIDEFDIHAIPTLIGEGIPLVAPRYRDVALHLRAVRKYPDGVVRLRYEVAK